MINHLDNMLRHLLLDRVPELTDETQVRFQPPDEQWRQYVSNFTLNGQPAMLLNVYMIDLRENRKLRSNERVRDVQNGFVTETQAPQRIDCHYLISAWSPAMNSVALEPTVDEHALLYSVCAALMTVQPFMARAIYAPAPLPAGFPDLIADAELPMVVLPVEGFMKMAEFWGTMGTIHPWKPMIHLIVTLPVAYPTQVAGGMVTTRITEYRQTGKPESSEVWVQIGGTVTDSLAQPVTNAWVQIETTAGVALQQADTSELGRFTFINLRKQQYRLRCRASGLGEIVRDIEVPSPSGEYDMQF